MKKIKYQKPKIEKRKIAPRFLLKRKTGFGGSDGTLMTAVWAMTMI